MTGLYLVRLMYILCSFYFRYVGSAKPGILGICNYSQNFRIFIWKVYYVLKIFHGTFFLNQFIFKNNCSLESVSIYYYLNIMRNKRNETSVFIHVLIQYKITTTHWSGAVQFYFMIWGRKCRILTNQIWRMLVIQKRPPWPTNNYESNQILPPVSYYSISKSCYLLPNAGISLNLNFEIFRWELRCHESSLTTHVLPFWRQNIIQKMTSHDYLVTVSFDHFELIFRCFVLFFLLNWRYNSPRCSTGSNNIFVGHG